MKEELIVLGTGHAVVTKCYNTCFAIKNDEGYFMVDTGGGSGILVQLEKAGISLLDIHHLFLTHGHTDHLTGLIWLVRLIAAMMNGGKYQGKAHRKIKCGKGRWHGAYLPDITIGKADKPRHNRKWKRDQRRNKHFFTRFVFLV